MRYLLVALLTLGLIMGCSEKKQSTKINVKAPEIKVPDVSKTTADVKAAADAAAKKAADLAAGTAKSQ